MTGSSAKNCDEHYKNVCHGVAGVTTEKELLSPDNKVHPDYYTDSLPDLLSVKQSVKA